MALKAIILAFITDGTTALVASCLLCHLVEEEKVGCSSATQALSSVMPQSPSLLFLWHTPLSITQPKTPSAFTRSKDTYHFERCVLEILTRG